MSPDGKLLAGALEEEIVAYDPGRGVATKLPGSRGRSCVWAPDGKHIIHSGVVGSDVDTLAIWWTRADGSTQPQKLAERKTRDLRVTSMSPDGRHLAFWTTRDETGGRPEIWTLNLDLRDPEHPKAEATQSFLSKPGGAQDAAFSPDGKWIAYTGRESGSHSPDIFVRPYPGTESTGQWQISSAGGGFPLWSPKGGQMYYLSNVGEIMVVDYRTGPGAFVASKPRPTGIRTAILATAIPYDASPDGKRFSCRPLRYQRRRASPRHVPFQLLRRTQA